MKPTANEDEPDVAVHTTHYKDARVHYPDLKQQPHTHPHAPHPRTCRQAGFADPTQRLTAPRRPEASAALAPDSSEPQQCAPTQPAGHRQPAHRPTPGTRRPTGWGNVDDSTSETPPRSGPHER